MMTIIAGQAALRRRSTNFLEWSFFVTTGTVRCSLVMVPSGPRAKRVWMAMCWTELLGSHGGKKTA